MGSEQRPPSHGARVERQGKQVLFQLAPAGVTATQLCGRWVLQVRAHSGLGIQSVIKSSCHRPKKR